MTTAPGEALGSPRPVAGGLATAPDTARRIGPGGVDAYAEDIAMLEGMRP